LVLLPRACSEAVPQSIVVEVDRISVFNVTDAAWSDIEVWLNDHYRMQAGRLAAGQRLDLPTRSFAASLGQRFDPAKQSLRGVEVTARGADGKAVRLTWGDGRRR
jgi:hypothetical protein